MKFTHGAVFLVGLAFLSPSVSAQMSFNEEQTAVWNIVAQSWEDEAARNGKWPAAYIHEDVVGWGADWPLPRKGDSMVKWSRFSEQSNKTLMYELFPAAIVVVGDTAVVHYVAVDVSENYEKKRERSSIGVVETLVRDGSTWKFLSLTGFEIDSDGGTD